jgi:translin
MENLNAIIGEAGASLDKTYQVRESALAHGRALTRTCANAIRAMHRGEFAEARTTLNVARQETAAMTTVLHDHPEVFFAGYVQDAHKELAEAECLMALLQNTLLPEPSEIGVAFPAYLNGLAEAASEGRRSALDSLRRGDLERAERLLGKMDDILSVLTTIDYPDAVTSGLRRTCDSLRAVVERTRGDVTLAVLHNNLLQSLRQTSEVPMMLPEVESD